MTEAELKELVRKAEERFAALTPGQQREHMREQAVSFVYGQMMDCAPHLTKEDIRKALDERP